MKIINLFSITRDNYANYRRLDIAQIPDMSDHIVWSSVTHLHRVVVRPGCGTALIGRAGLVNMEPMNTRGQIRQTTVDLKSIFFLNKMNFELEIPLLHTSPVHTPIRKIHQT